MVLPENPLNEIALCFSGGGYRATAFHLGSLHCLHSLQLDGNPLLHKVKALSTVSGGTFTGVIYAMMSQKGKPFQDIYHEIVTMLMDHDLVAESIEKIKDPQWKYPQKQNRNIINAFAEIYDELLTHGETYDLFLKKPHSHLETMIFNATEFVHGLSFRFTSEWKKDKLKKAVRRGNNHFQLSMEGLSEIRLSDIIAASSCFPGGFEPIKFPHDFLGNNSPHLSSLLHEEKYRDGIGLMDGGIYDNQGIDSIKLAEDRRKSGPGIKSYDLLIISDVTSPDIASPFSFYKTSIDTYDKFSVSGILKVIMLTQKSILFIALALAVGSVFLFYFSTSLNTFKVGMATAMSLLAILVFLFYSFFRRVTESTGRNFQTLIEKELDPFFIERLSKGKFQDFTWKQIKPLVFNRIHSLKVMALDVFTKQVRRLSYNAVFEDDNYNHKRVAILIKKLTKSDWSKTQHQLGDGKWYAPIKGEFETIIPESLANVIQDASQFGTTLWFTEIDEMDQALYKLLAAGRATTCFGLIEHLADLLSHPEFSNYPAAIKNKIKELYNQSLQLWEIIRKDAYYDLKISS